jgi:hypothetical protein
LARSETRAVSGCLAEWIIRGLPFSAGDMDGVCSETEPIFLLFFAVCHADGRGRAGWHQVDTGGIYVPARNACTRLPERILRLKAASKSLGRPLNTKR